MALLEVRDLTTTFRTDDGLVGAVDHLSFELEPGRVLGIVGESGSGKSVTSLSIMRLLDGSSADITGSVKLNGRELLSTSSEEMRRIRGREIAMIFQDPMTSLNPVYSVGSQLSEAVRIHNPDVSRSQARARAVEMLEKVGIPRPAERLKSYPHEFSGGMRQRVMIAMALINDPKVLIADEPTTALDVTTQAQILNLINTLRTEFDSGIIMITHDLGVVAEVCDDVLVMYGGRVVEQAGVDDIFERPQHPYTWGLLGSLPARAEGEERLLSIPGTPPSLLRPPRGCRFNPRCSWAMDRCRKEAPALAGVDDQAPGHVAACWLDSETRAAESARIAGGGRAAHA